MMAGVRVAAGARKVVGAAMLSAVAAVAVVLH